MKSLRISLIQGIDYTEHYQSNKSEGFEPPFSILHFTLYNSSMRRIPVVIYEYR